MKTPLILLLFLFGLYFPLRSQISLVTNILEDFGTVDISGSWVDNTTILGWYSSHNNLIHENVDASSPNNTGGLYHFECESNNDQKLGAKPSNETGDIQYGIRLLNNSGSEINHLYVQFNWYQFSLAQNGNNVNEVQVCYQINPTVTSVSSGTWTIVPSLSFNGPNDSSTPGVSFEASYPCTVTGSKSSCVSANVPVGHEIMFRFSDRNDPQNDHHLGIDNLFIGISPDVMCATILSIDLEFFKISYEDKTTLEWRTFSEIDNDYFILTSSRNGKFFEEIGRVQSVGNSPNPTNYIFTLEPEILGGLAYYRLQAIDINGKITNEKTISVNSKQSEIIRIGSRIHLNQVGGLSKNTFEVQIHDIYGKKIYEANHQNDDIILLDGHFSIILTIPSLGIRMRL